MQGFKSTLANPYSYPQQGVWRKGQYTFQAIVKSDSGYAFAFQRADTTWQTIDLSWQVRAENYCKVQWTFTLEEEATVFKLIANDVTGETLLCQPMLESGSNRSTPIAHEEDLRGMDGDNHEFIFIRNTTGIAPETPLSTQDNDYIPEGWTDNAQGVTSEIPFEFVSMREKKNGVWLDFSPPSLWAKWGEDGLSVNLHVEGHYNSKWVGVTKVTEIIGGVDVGGSEVVKVSAVFRKGETNIAATEAQSRGFQWYVNNVHLTEFDDQPYITLDETYGDGFADYVVLSYLVNSLREEERREILNVSEGMDGIGEEFIFKAHDDGEVAPVLPQTTDEGYQNDDYHGDWHDNPVAPTEVLQFVWVAKRKKVGGEWQAFGVPSVWTKWVTDGEDGKDAVAPIIINGHWAFWDEAIQDYVESAFLAIGDDGHSPYVDENTGTWWEWNDANGTYQDTGVTAKGDDGADAKTLTLSASSVVMACTSDNQPKAGQTIVINAKLQNVVGSVTFTAIPYNDAGTALTAVVLGDNVDNNKEKTLTNAQWLATYNRVVITATRGALTDTVTITRLADATDGEDGDGITSTTIEYAKSSSGTTPPSTGWNTALPSPTLGWYLWTRTTTTYKVAATTVTYSVSRWAEDGDGIVSTTIEYAQSSSGTTPPTTGWSTSLPTPTLGWYLWTRTTTTYKKSSSTVAYSVSRYAEDGEDGVVKTISLSATTNAIHITEGNTPIPASVTVTGTAKNTTIQYWYYSVDGASSFTSSTPNGVSRSGSVVTINSSNATFRTLSIKARNSADDVEAVVTITRGGGAPYVNSTTNTWWAWDDATGAFTDTGMSPVGHDGAIPYPAGYYDNSKWYRREDEYAPYVQYGEVLYLLRLDTPNAGIPTSNTTYWKAFNQWEAVFVTSLVAKFAKIGGAVFTGDTSQTSSAIKGRLISEMGANGSTNYKSYTGDGGAWQPKLMLDFLTGKVKFEDANISGTIHATTGELGELTLMSGGFIDLPPSFTTSIVGRIDSSGIRLVYNGSYSQSINWYTGLGTFAGEITPDSNGHLKLYSSFGLKLVSDGDISIGADGLSGNINIGNTLKSVDFGGATVSNIKKITSLGFPVFAYSTVSMSPNTNYTINTDTPLLVITSAGVDAGILKINKDAAGNSPDTGMMKIICNATNTGIRFKCTTTGSNIRYGEVNSEYILHGNALAVLIYYSGYWRIHLDRGQ